MVKINSRLIIITRLDLNNKHDGHVVYFTEFIEDLLKNYTFKEIAIWTPNKLNFDIKGIVFYHDLPKLHSPFSLLRNVRFYLRRLKSYDVVQHWYLPRLFIWQVLITRHKKNVIVFPDSWRAYFRSKFNVERQFIDVLRSVYYGLKEFLLSHLGSTILIAEDEAQLYNGFHIPHRILANFREGPDRCRQVLIGRMSKSYVSQVLNNVVLKLPNVNFVMITNDDKTLTAAKNIPNLEIVESVTNYSDYSSQFKIHLIYDIYTSGMSTKFINAVNTNTFVLGNSRVFRGFRSLDIPDICLYRDWIECTKHIEKSIDLESKKCMDIYDEFYSSLRLEYGERYRKEMLIKIYT